MSGRFTYPGYRAPGAAPTPAPVVFASHVDLLGTHATPVRWNPRSKMLHAEASDLGFTAGQVPNNVHIRSHRTGQIGVFTNPQPHVTPTCPDGCCGGDLHYWTLTGPGGARLVVFND